MAIPRACRPSSRWARWRRSCTSSRGPNPRPKGSTPTRCSGITRSTSRRKAGRSTWSIPMRRVTWSRGRRTVTRPRPPVPDTCSCHNTSSGWEGRATRPRSLSTGSSGRAPETGCCTSSRSPACGPTGRASGPCRSRVRRSGDAGSWLRADARDEGADFASTLPGGELGGLYSVQTAGELFKLVARFFAYVASVPEASSPRPGRPPEATGPDGDTDAESGPEGQGPRRSALPYMAVGLG